MLAAQRATLHGASRALALGARPQPPTRHSSACWSAPGSVLCAAIPAAHTCTIAEIFVRLGAAAGGGSKLSEIQQLPAGRQEDLRPQLHQLALAWHAGKGTKDELSSTDNRAPFAVILAKNSSLRQRIAVVSSLSSFALSAHFEQLRSRLDPLDRE
jgi:hypothetical protein